MSSPVKDAKNKHIAKGFTEVAERGRGFLRSRKPGTNQYALASQVGGVGWHRGNGPYTEADEVDTAWVQNGVTYDMLLGDPFQAQVNLAQQSYRYEDMDTGESVELFAESVLQWTNGTQVELAAGLSAPSVGVDDDTITFDGLFGAGTRLSIQAQTARLKKLLTIDSLGLLSTPTLSGTVSLSFSLRFQRSSGVTIWVDGAEWDENGAVSTTSAVEFRNTAGETLFVFSPVYALDSSVEATKQYGTMNLRQAGANLFADVLIPYSWIETAVFPIVIDPSVDPQLGASSDDAWSNGGQTVADLIGVEMYLGMSLLTHSPNRTGGVRYQVNVPQGATIDVAYLTFCRTNSNASIIVPVIVYAQDSDTAATWSTTGHIVTQTTPLTTAFVAIKDTRSYTVGVQTRLADDSSDDITAIIQEVVDRASWASGNYMRLSLEGYNGDGDYQASPFQTYDGSTSLASILHIGYTAASAVSILPAFRTVRS